MFFNVISVILCIYTVLSPLLMLKCVKFGFGMHDNPQKEIEKPIIPRKAKDETIELTKEQQEDIEFMMNVMNYNGDELGQKIIGDK